MKNFPTTCIVASIFLIAILGCGGLKNLIPKPGQYFQGDSAQKAAKAIRDKIGKPFNTIEVFIDDSEFRVQAQDPNNPKHVDEYKYVAGMVTGPTPVQLSSLVSDPDKSSYPFDDIDFSAIPKFTKEALDKAGIEGGRIYRLTFQRGFAITDKSVGALGKPYWNIEINGSRENVTAAADPKGNLLGVDLSRTSKANDYTVLAKPELQKAQDALRNYLASRPVIEITMYDKSITCKVANMENPKVTDSVKYDINGLSSGDLVKLPNIQIPGDENFQMSDVDLANAADWIEKAKDRVSMPDSTLAVLIIKRNKSPFNNKGYRTLWDINLKSGVKEASITYDNSGNEVRITKNGDTIFEEK